MGDKILVVEDEPDIAEIVRYNLEQAVFEAVVDGDGGTGLLYAADASRTAAAFLLFG